MGQLVSSVNINFLGLRRFKKDKFEGYDNIEHINNFNDIIRDNKWYYGDSKRILYKNNNNNYIYVSHDLFSILTTIDDYVIELIRIYRKSYNGYFLITDISGTKDNIRVNGDLNANNILKNFYNIKEETFINKLLELKEFVLKRIEDGDTKAIKTKKADDITIEFSYFSEEDSLDRLKYLENPEMLYDLYKDKAPINTQRTRDAIVFYKSLFDRNLYGTQQMWEKFIDYICDNHYSKFRISLIEQNGIQLFKPEIEKN